MIEDVALKCPICNIKTTWKSILESKDGLKKIYYCVDCELRRLHPIPTQDILQGMYQKLTQSYSYEKAKLCDKSVEYYDNIIKKYSKNKTQKYLLDIGAGLGYYSESFARLNYTVTYCDADAVSAKFSMENHKHINRFINANFEDYLSTTNDKFDVIFCRHVIEHIFNPDKFVQLMKKSLKKDGILILETDNNNSTELLDHNQVVEYWGKYYLEHFNINDINELKKLKVTAIGENNTHWWAFRKTNLKKLLENNGYEPLLIIDYYLGDEYLWPNITPITSLEKQSKEGAGILVVASSK